MKEYYFLASILPQLEIGHVPALGFPEFKQLLVENLSKEDLLRTYKFLRWIDFENLRAYWSGQPFDARGNFNEEEIERILLDERWPSGEEFPNYLQDYLDKYQTREERLKHFPLLISQFFIEEIENEKGFLRDFFIFQREMRLVMVGFRAKKTRMDISEQLQYEDPTDPIVAQILAQKDAKVYEPPFEYKELKPIFEEFSDQPLELFKAIYEYQFYKIIDLAGGAIFTLDRILNYMARLLLVERWLDLDIQKGIQVIDAVEKEIK